MCLYGNGGGGGGGKPKAPTVAPPPTVRPPTTPPGTPPADPDARAIDQARRALQRRQGIFGNIRTSPMGDPGYGRSRSSGTATMSGGYASFGGPQ
jgi:hypothetical protein